MNPAGCAPLDTLRLLLGFFHLSDASKQNTIWWYKSLSFLMSLTSITGTFVKALKRTYVILIFFEPPPPPT